MKKVFENLKKFVKGGALAFMVIALVSCGEDSGLGASVDTEVPTISISYPPASAAIRGNFLLSGTWDDDKGISGITVSILNTTTKESFASDEVEFSSDKTWKVKINRYDSSNSSYTNGWQLSDGKYQISVVVKDAAGHSSSPVSRTFEIDNTAPVIVLSSPGSTSNYTKYGSNFKVEGTIADEHSISSLAVTIFDEDGNVLDDTDSVPYSETNVATAGGTSVSLLKFSANPVTTAQN